MSAGRRPFIFASYVHAGARRPSCPVNSNGANRVNISSKRLVADRDRRLLALAACGGDDDEAADDHDRRRRRHRAGRRCNRAARRGTRRRRADDRAGRRRRRSRRAPASVESGRAVRSSSPGRRRSSRSRSASASLADELSGGELKVTVEGPGHGRRLRRSSAPARPTSPMPRRPINDEEAAGVRRRRDRVHRARGRDRRPLGDHQSGQHRDRVPRRPSICTRCIGPESEGFDNWSRRRRSRRRGRLRHAGAVPRRAAGVYGTR